jgi:transcriptional regulator GlxA family with amidase domain
VTATRPFRSVAAYLPSCVGDLSLGIVGEVFGCDRSAGGLPGFDFACCAHRPGRVRTESGIEVQVDHGLDRLVAADLVIVLPPGYAPDRPEPPEVLAALREAHRRGAIVASCCTGAFTLADTGLLDGRRATTHWQWAERFAARYPSVTLHPDVLYVDEGDLLTGAGSAAGMDLLLHLLRREYGAAVATAFARHMVVAPHRDGGQAQFVARPLPDGCCDDNLSGVLEWALANLDRPLTVERLAARALMSPRSFARRFREATGTTPAAWLRAQRLRRAEELLETGDLSVEEVARRVGFGSAAALREHFVRQRGVPPRDYRRAFAGR